MTTPDRLGGDPLASDPYAHWDAAYVLGALSPAQRREFEEHLAGCSHCQTSVAELAGMPGLLAQVSPEDAAALAEATETANAAVAPQNLMPRLVADLPTWRRRTIRAVVAVAAAIVLLVSVVGVAVVWGPLSISLSSATAPYRLAFSPVVESGITGVVDVVPVKGGTEFRVECQYAGVDETRPGGANPNYSIVVTDRSGAAAVVKTWPARPGLQMRPKGTSPLPVKEIEKVEIRAVDSGETLLRAELR